MMKRVFAFVLVMILLLSLTACGKSEEEQAQNEIYEHMKEGGTRWSRGSG